MKIAANSTRTPEEVATGVGVAPIDLLEAIGALGFVVQEALPQASIDLGEATWAEDTGGADEDWSGYAEVPAWADELEVGVSFQVDPGDEAEADVVLGGYAVTLTATATGWVTTTTTAATVGTGLRPWSVTGRTNIGGSGATHLTGVRYRCLPLTTIPSPQ